MGAEVIQDLLEQVDLETEIGWLLKGSKTASGQNESRHSSFGRFGCLLDRSWAIVSQNG